MTVRERAMVWPWALETMAILFVAILRLHFKNRAWDTRIGVWCVIGLSTDQANSAVLGS